MITFNLLPDILPLKFTYCVGEWDDAAIKRVAKKEFGCENYENVVPTPDEGCCLDFNGGYIIFIKEVPVDTFMLGILTHEVNHATLLGLRHIGMGFSKSSDEAYTYLSQYLVTHGLNKMVKAQNKQIAALEKKAAPAKKAAAKKTTKRKTTKKTK